MDQQEQNESESYFKQQYHQGSEKAKEEGKKKAAKSIIKWFLSKKALCIAAIVIAAVIVIIILLAGFDYIINLEKEKDVNDAKELAIDTSYYDTISTGGIVKTDEQGALEKPSKKDLEKIIEERFEGDQQENLLGVVDDLIYIQDEYKVNAIFAIAVFQIESSCGTNWALIDSSTYNWASIQGSYNGQSYTDSNGTSWRSYPNFNEATRDFGALIGKDGPYFSEDRYSISEIGEKYCDPPEEWIDAISKCVIEMYEILGETVEINNTKNIIAIVPNEDNTAYEISYNDDEEYLESIKKWLYEETPLSASNFTDFELAVLGALKESGATFDNYTEEELHCLVAFIKAEACTQYLDLRPNSEKLNEDGEYVPAKLEDLEENEVPGTILVQRTNTNTANRVESKNQNNEDNEDNEEENVNEESNEESNEENSGENNEESNNNKVLEGTILEYMVEEEFNKLLEDEEFTEEEVEEILKYFTINKDGEIVIANWSYKLKTVTGEYPENLDDSKKETNENKYTIGTEKVAYSEYVQKYIMPFEFLTQLLVTTNSTEFCMELVDFVVDSKIIINLQEEETFKVTDQTKNYTRHYKNNKYAGYQIIEEDRILKQSPNQFLAYTRDDEGNACTSYSNGNYVVSIHIEETNHSYKFEIVEVDTWLAHYLKEYADQEKEEKSEPESTTTENEEYKMIGTGSRSNYNGDNDVAAFYNRLKYAQKFVYPNAECNITSLYIAEYAKINLTTTTNVKITKYPSDPNPTTSTHIYATEDGEPGRGYRDKDTVYEKFLVAYNNSPGARNNLNSIDSWLYSMMEERESTVELIDIVKYLLYMYDGVSRGVTDLEGFEDLFAPDSFRTIGGIYGGSTEEKIWWALLDAGYSKEAAAGVLGNVYKESGFICNNMEDGYETNGSYSNKLIYNGKTYTDETYTEAIDDGSYPREQFIHDSVGYGLAQWTYFSLKEELYDFAKDKNASIGDENMQIEFLVEEIDYSNNRLVPRKGYTRDDWENADSPEEAAVAFCWLYENPAGDGDVTTRKLKAREYYEKFKDKERAIGGDILQVAAELHELLKNNYYGGGPLADIELFVSGDYGYSVCASYVAGVLYLSGYYTEEEINTCGNDHNTPRKI